MIEIKTLPEGRFLKSKPNSRIYYPFEKLEVGQYFELPEDKKSSVYNSLKHRIKYTKELEGRKFTVRTQDDLIYIIRVV